MGDSRSHLIHVPLSLTPQMIQGGRNRLLQVSQRPFHVGDGGSSGHKAPCPLLRPSLRRWQLPGQLLLLLLQLIAAAGSRRQRRRAAANHVQKLRALGPCRLQLILTSQ